MKYYALVAGLCLFLTGCVSSSMLPQSASGVDFSTAKTGKTGFSKYEQTFFLKGVDKETAHTAAQKGLVSAGFTVTKADLESGVAIGEHGITMHDWNVVTGVYVKQEKGGTRVKMITEGSKDTGFWGDVTSDDWPQSIYKGMTEYLATEGHPQ